MEVAIASMENLFNTPKSSSSLLPNIRNLDNQLIKLAPSII
jgi:hypothetical protein